MTTVFLPALCQSVYERFRRAVIAGRLLRVTGTLQREAGVVHVQAKVIAGLPPPRQTPAFALKAPGADDQP